MKVKIHKIITTSIFLLLISNSVCGQLFPNLGGQRVGTSAAQFLKIGIGARSLGMGESFVAVANDAEALYWNPAGISQFNKNALFFSHIKWFVDINVDYAGLVYHINTVNSIGLFFTVLSTEDMMETTELQPFGTGRYFSYSDLVAGLTYARNMTDKFSFGITVKYLNETLAELSMSSFLFDFGTYYKTGWKTTRFAVSVSNFGPEIAPSGSFIYENLDNEKIVVDEFQKFSPPIMFRIGIATEIFENSIHKLTWSVQLNHPNDNIENINLGVEYWWRRLIAIRGGYITGRVERDISVGLGINIPAAGGNLHLDYSFSNFGRLGYINQFTVHLVF